jgi:toxin ParE1/3/4
LKPAHLRPRAEADLVEAARYYAQEGGLALGERMFDAAIGALEPVERMPSMGSYMDTSRVASKFLKF